MSHSEIITPGSHTRRRVYGPIQQTGSFNRGIEGETPAQAIVRGASRRRGGGGGSSGGGGSQARAEALARAEEQARAEAQARVEELARQKAISDQKQFETTVKFRKKPTAQEERLQMSIPESTIISPGTTPSRPPKEIPFWVKQITKTPTERVKEFKKTTDIFVKSPPKDVRVGVAKAGISIAEGSINLFSQLGVQKLEITEEGTIKDRKTFEFGGKLGEIRDSPVTAGSIVGQASVFGPILIAGGIGFISTASKVGVRSAVVEGASAFSPFKIRSGSFGPLQTEKNIQDLEFGVLSVKSSKGDITKRIVGGKEKVFEDVFISSKQILKGSGDDVVGGAVTDITAPKTTFKIGKFSESIETVRIESLVRGQPGKATRIKGFESLKLSEILGKTSGTKGDIISRTKSVIEIHKKGLDAEFFGDSVFSKSIIGGVSKSIKPGFAGFGSGRGQTQIKVDSSGIKRNIKVERFNIKGVEIDLSAFNQKGLPKKINLKSKSQKTITKTSDLISGSIEQLKPVITPTKTPKSLIIKTISPKISTVESSNIIQTPQEVSISKTRLGTTIKPSTDQKISITPTTKQKFQTKTKQKFQTKTKQKQKLKPLQITKQIPSLKTSQKSSQKLRSALKTIQIQKPRAEIFIGIDPKKPKTPTTAGFGFKLGKKKKKKKKGGLFTVEVRRGGVFKTVGTSTDILKAVSIGKGITASTLGATFRIKGAKRGSVGTPAGFRLPKASSKIAGPLTFIEKSKFRLSKAGEIGEIQRAKRIKTTGKKKR